MKRSLVLLVLLIPILSLALLRDAAAQATWRQPWKVNHCTGNGTRQYSAQLMNIPWGRSWESFCASMPATINGQFFPRPTRCVNNFGMWGEFDEVSDPSCAAHWGPFVPGACTSGMRTHSARLWNINGDWLSACSATPATVAGRTFVPPALRCISRGVAGMWGEVDIPDGSCSNLQVVGAVTYDDSVSPLLPATRAFARGTIELWACGTWVGPFCSWGRIASTTSDTTGSFSFTISGGRDIADFYVVRVVATNDAAIVFAQDTLNVFYADLGAPQTATPTRRLLTFNRWFGNSGHDLFVARHLNAAQKLYFAREFLVNHRDPSETDGLGKVIVSPSVATGIPFTNSGLIFINPNDMMMDHTLLHEYGHYAQESIGAYYIAPRFHSLCAITDPQYAWFEGFPTFFSRAVRLFYPGEFNVPSSPASCMRSGDQAAIEGVVSDVLVWLLNDAGGARRIMSIFDKEFDYSAPGNKDLRRFREVWSNRRASMTYIDWVYQRFGLLP